MFSLRNGQTLIAQLTRHKIASSGALAAVQSIHKGVNWRGATERGAKLQKDVSHRVLKYDARCKTRLAPDFSHKSSPRSLSKTTIGDPAKRGWARNHDRQDNPTQW